MGTKMTKLNESSKIVGEFTKRLINKYQTLDGMPSYAYATGYMESMLAEMLLDLPKAKQQYYIDIMKGE